MKKKIAFIISTLIMSLSLPLLSYASTFSEYWYQDSQGNWHIQDQNGNMVTNAWLCDDAVASNGQDIWYLIDSNGNMVSAGLVQDQTGNIYSIETSHNGFYGMLRYQSGTYDGVYLDLESSHNGGFSRLKNQDGINGLQGIYGLTQVNIDNSNCVYTSSFRNSNKKENYNSGDPYSLNPYNPQNTDGNSYQDSDYHISPEDEARFHEFWNEHVGGHDPNGPGIG